MAKVSEELGAFHTVCGLAAMEASCGRQPNSELIAALNAAAREAMISEPVENVRMIAQTCLFVARKVIDDIVRLGRDEPFPPLEDLILAACSFYHEHHTAEVATKDVSTTLLRSISNVCMLLDKPMCAPGFESFFRILVHLLCTVVDIDFFRADVYSGKNTPVAASLVHVCLRTLITNGRDIDTRLMAARLLQRFVLGAKRAQLVGQVAFVLPGILVNCMKIALNDQNSFIIKESILIMVNSIETTMNNRMFERNRDRDKQRGSEKLKSVSGKLWTAGGSAMLIPMESTENELAAEDGVTTDWKEITSIFSTENSILIGHCMKQLSARLCKHTDHKVRMCVLDSIRFVTLRCERSLGCVLERTAQDVGTILLADKYPSIQAKSLSLLRVRRNNALKEKNLRRTLSKVNRSINIGQWRNGDVSIPFQQMIGILHRTRAGDLCEAFRGDEKLLEGVVDSTLLCTTVNRSAMDLVVEVESDSNDTDVCSRLKLRDGVSIKDIERICAKLARCAAQATLSYCEQKTSNTKSPEQKLACAIVSLLVVRQFVARLTRRGGRVLQDSSIETVFKSMIDRISTEFDTIRFMDTAVIGEFDPAVIRIAVDLCVVGAAFRGIASTQTKFRLLSRCLVLLLEWRASAIKLVSTAAHEAAQHLAQGIGERSVSSMCFKYTNALLSYICVSGSSWQLVRSARLVTSLLAVCKEKAFFQTACLMNEQMLSLLDRSEEDCKTAVLQAMTSFVTNVTQWFWDEKEPDNAYLEDDTKARSPPFVTAVEAVLKRTKHLTSSRAVKVRLQVLLLVEKSFTALTHFPGSLCPLVHENWPGVKNNAIGECYLLRKRAFKVILAMCRATGSFMYRRFKLEVWPIITKSMSDLLAKQHSSTVLSDAHKYQRSVLKHAVSIWKCIEPLPEDWSSVGLMLQSYSQSILLPSSLKDVANEQLEQYQIMIAQLPSQT